MNFMRNRILPTSVIIAGIAGIFLLAFNRERLFASIIIHSIAIETARIPELAPHEHGAADAVSDTGHHSEVFSDDYVVPRNMKISFVNFEVLNAPSSIVHHAAVIAYRCVDDACTERIPREIVRHGQDTMYLAKGEVPEGFMIPLKKGDKIRVELTAHNPDPPRGSGETYHDVYARITLEENRWKTLGARPVRFVHLFVQDTCTPLAGTSGPDSFTVPPDTEYRFSGCPGDNSRITFTQPGVVTHMGAHLHGWQGGKELVVFKNNEVFHVFTTSTSTEDPLRYDTPHTRTQVLVEPGDSFSLSALYSNQYSVPVRGVMGMFGFYLADDDADVF